MNNTNTDRFVDRTKFPSGPWDREPDKIQWTTKANLPGLIVRNHTGALCGYAAVTTGHPLYGNDYEQAKERYDIHVHGGLTYSNKCQEDGPICHVPQPGEPDNVWWFGFDCAHIFDLVPHTGYDSCGIGETHVYRDINYVGEQVEKLATQLATIGN